MIRADVAVLLDEFHINPEISQVILRYCWKQVLLTTVKAMAPFTPFFAEGMYQNLRRALPDVEESVHYCSFPEVESEVS
jgi:isoleucyl-tRNA synthetase